MAAPSKKGEYTGQVVEKQQGRSGTKQYWKWNGNEWLLGTGADAKKNKEQYLEQKGGNTSYTQLTVGSTTGSVRYPKDAAMASNSDYVLFEFYKYQPPFKGINKGATKDNGTALSVYNQSATDAALYKKVDGLQTIILYMPEDVSTGYKANWSGKAFSNIGAAAMATFGSGDFGQLSQNALNTIGTAFDNLLPNVGVKTVQGIISKVTGEQLSDNDVFAGTQGVIRNPNVELLFGGHDLRNFQLNYKLVPRNKPEADNIKQIVNIFRKAMLPSFSTDTSLEAFGGAVEVGGQNISNSFIQVPSVCKVTFMKGSEPNTNVAQYKMCAITQVDINYTPDGAYATYDDGSMVAIGLSLAFQETKLVFAEEVEQY
jgi:hypothetical protein